MKLGTIDIDKPLFLAPMEDVSDKPFRIICKRLGADIVVTEFTSCEALIRDIPRALSKLDFTQEERPLGIQIFGSVEESMERAAARTEKFNPEFIDLNCGCWVKNHCKRGEGAALLKDLPKFEAIVKSTVKATKLPVTVKTRLGWDNDSIVILEAAKMIEQAGAKMLTLHCRTRSQGYTGNADWHWLEKVKKAVTIPVIGNGDITCEEDAKRMLETGCDGVMIGRGAISNPWIFSQVKHFLKTGQKLPAPTLEERFNICIQHLRLAVDVKGIKGGLIPFRKFYSGYLKGVPNVSHLRSEIIQMIDLEQIVVKLNEFVRQNNNQPLTDNMESIK